MGNQRGDDRYGGGNRSGGDDRWRDRDPGSNYGGGDWSGGRPRGEEDRGFFERAGEQVRSWFGDDDDERGRGGGRFERGSSGRGGSDSFGGGWGNQQGESWNRDRPGVASGGYGSGRDYANDWGSGDRSRSDEGGYARDYQASGGGSDRFEGGFGQESRASETWGGSGFGGGTDHGRRFDRVDAGSTGSHGAHPMSSPVGGAYGAGYGASAGGGYGSSARTAAMLGGGGGRGASSGGGFGGGRGGGIHDPHYSEWRNRQIEQLDRDYEEYRREHQSKFEQEFGGWREKRQGQRSSLSRVTEHMEVLGSDGQHIGTVDKVRGDRIILTKSDENAGGRHHSIPCSWIDSVDDKVRVDKTAEEATNAWRDEERNQALFEREDPGSEGPHMLNRSFSGTYRDRDE
ncbi:MAG TPA: DUF2171 domain-containing protein [Allosphingosinicella sp.]|nr:DUF2171 domain-containing protein [Allosphingosinicella sp.]